MTAEQRRALVRLRDRVRLLEDGRRTLVVSRDDVEALLLAVAEACGEVGLTGQRAMFAQGVEA